MRKALVIIAEIGAAVAVIAGGVSWGIKTHNQFLMDAIGPLLRTAYVTRINNYRRILCDGGSLTVDQQVAFDEVQADYEALVGRPIGERGCN